MLLPTEFKQLAKGLYEAIAGVGGVIPTAFGILQDLLQDMAAKIGAGFMMITQALTGFVNGVLVAGQYIAETILRRCRHLHAFNPRVVYKCNRINSRVLQYDHR